MFGHRMDCCFSGRRQRRKRKWIRLCNMWFIVLIKKKKVNLEDPSHIVAITRDTYYKLPYENGKTKYNYVVTALDRLHNESKGAKKKVKL